MSFAMMMMLVVALGAVAVVVLAVVGYLTRRPGQSPAFYALGVVLVVVVTALFVTLASALR